MCHQTLEKGLKAYWCATMPDDPPYTHNLLSLITGANLATALSDEQKQFKNLLKQLPPERCQDIITKTNDFYLWIKSKLPK